MDAENRSALVDAGADNHLAGLLAIGRLREHLLAHGIGKFVVLPELALALGEGDSFLDEILAVGIGEIDQGLPDLFLVLTMGEALAGYVLDHPI